MTITVQIKGTEQFAEFPDGTPPEVIEQALAGKTAEPDFFGAGVIEPVRAIGSGINAAIESGLMGTVQALNPLADEGAGAQSVQARQQDVFTPQTQAGREGLASVQSGIEAVSDVVNIPLSGIGGLVELVSGQGIDQAVETLRNIQEQGVSKTLGERVFEETGSPLAATTAQLAPEAIGAAIGLKGAGRAIKATEKAAGVAEDVVSNVPEITKGIFDFQTPTKQRIAELLVKESGDIETAGFELKDATGIPDLRGKSKLHKILNIGGPKVASSKLEDAAINQGFDKGFIAAIKNASKEDVLAFKEMTNIAERTTKNRMFGQDNRPNQVTGKTLSKRIKLIRDVNQKAGSDIDKIANRDLRNKSVDIAPAVNQFISDLENIDIQISQSPSGKLALDFSQSNIVDMPGPQRLIKLVFSRMNKDAPDALDVHKLKRLIDDQVSFGKVAEGLTGSSERVIKSLRHNLDTALDNKFGRYDAANTAYADTIGALDEIQRLAGKNTNLSSATTDRALGVLLRRIMSNAQSGSQLVDAITEIDRVSSKYGGDFKDNLKLQILYADELDRMFKIVPQTSFQGQIGQAIEGSARAATPTGAVDLGLKAVGKMADKAQGINEENAFKAMRELLKGE